MPKDGVDLDFVVTGISERFWSPWGASWILSLRKLANTQAQILVYDYGLRSLTKEKLRSFGCQIVEGSLHGTLRSSTLKQLLNKISVGDRYCYFDADIWFQKNFDEIFDSLSDQIAICQNLDHGFLGLNSKSSKNLLAVMSILNHFSEPEMHLNVHGHFDRFFSKVHDKYNVINLPRIDDQDGVLFYQKEEISGIHPTGQMKHAASGRHLLFHERYKDLFDEHVSSKRILHMDIRPKKFLSVNTEKT